ncbi:MAG: ABC transporter permease subunit, partial [Chloroflexi bacterium]|nr:ABC transporter permease subunit [Chloroflexota bacterium]
MLTDALIITRREIRDSLRDWRIVAPIIILTLIFPWIMNLSTRVAINFVEEYNAVIIPLRLVPFAMMIVGFFPISFSLIIALETFVGEKERNSLEPLLGTPIADASLYVGKLLSAMLPPLFASYLGVGAYLLGLFLSIQYAPDGTILAQIILLTTMEALVMVAGAVVVSSHTTSVRAANLLASFIIIPMAFLLQAESVLLFWGQYDVLWYIILALLIADIIL